MDTPYSIIITLFEEFHSRFEYLKKLKHLLAIILCINKREKFN